MTASERAEIRALITSHEGYRRHPYRCTAGKLTIGCGRNLDDVGIDEEEARFLLDRDIQKCVADLSQWPWFEALDTIRRRALIDMRFQLGPGGFRSFRQMLTALAAGDFETASAEVLHSKYAKHDAPTRASSVAEMIRTGRDA